MKKYLENIRERNINDFITRKHKGYTGEHSFIVAEINKINQYEEGY